jgi:hypothetical protein
VLGLENDLDALARDDRAGRLLQDQALPERRRRSARARPKPPEPKVPPFDLNPNTERADYVLNIDWSDNCPVLATAVETSGWYGGSKDGRNGGGSLARTRGGTPVPGSPLRPPTTNCFDGGRDRLRSAYDR